MSALHRGYCVFVVIIGKTWLLRFVKVSIDRGFDNLS